MAKPKIRSVIIAVVLLMLMVGSYLAWRKVRQDSPEYYLARAKAAEESGNLEGKGIELLNLVSHFPTHTAGHLALAEVYLQGARERGKPATYATHRKALIHLTLAARSKPTDAALQRKLMSVYLAQGKLRDAASIADRLVAQHEIDADVLYLISWRSMDRLREAEADVARMEYGEQVPIFRAMLVRYQMMLGLKYPEKTQATLDAALAQAGKTDSKQLAALPQMEFAALLELLGAAIEQATDRTMAEARAMKALGVLEGLAANLPPAPTELKGLRSRHFGTLADLATRMVTQLRTRYPHQDIAIIVPGEGWQAAFDTFGQLLDARKLIAIRAENLRQQAIDAGEASTHAHEQSAQWALAQQDRSRAIRCLEQGIVAAEASGEERAQEAAGLHRLAARWLIAWQRPADAKPHVDFMLNNAEEKGWGHLFAGIAAQTTNQSRDALGHFLQARAQLGNDPLVHTGLAAALVAEQRWPDAIAELKSLPENYAHIKPEDRALAEQLFASPEQISWATMKAHLALSQWKEADAQAEIAAGPTPKATLCTNVCGAFRTAGYFPGAYRWAERAVAAADESEQVNAHLQLASLAMEQGLGRRDKQLLGVARDHFTAVVEREPQHLVACTNLAWLLSTTFKDPEAAVALVERARGESGLETLPPQFVDTWIVIFRQAGRAEAALLPLRAAVERAPTYAKLHFHLGMMLAMAQQSDEATTALNKSLQLGLLAPQANEARQQLTALMPKEPPTKSQPGKRATSTQGSLLSTP